MLTFISRLLFGKRKFQTDLPSEIREEIKGFEKGGVEVPPEYREAQDTCLANADVSRLFTLVQRHNEVVEELFTFFTNAERRERDGAQRYRVKVFKDALQGLGMLRAYAGIRSLKKLEKGN